MLMGGFPKLLFANFCLVVYGLAAKWDFGCFVFFDLTRGQG
jgi:hypothetical protein